MALCLSLCFGAVAANAQIDTEVTVEANIPHPFVVEKTTLPAGRYMIKLADTHDNDLNTMEIRSVSGHTAVFFETEDEKAKENPSKTELVFNKVGDTYFLSEVFVAGDYTGNKLRKSRMEERLEAKGMTAERHSVAAVGRPLK
jgi:uncharacterized DUF497 family protein